MKSTIVSFVAATTLLASSVSALQCGKGYGPKNGVCELCDPGYYNDQDAGECKPAQPGWYAGCNSDSLACYGATQQTQCGKGYYATGNGNAYCTICPAGNICQSDTTDQPLPCVPGRYMPDEGSGASQCLECPVGTFNNESGATACCLCCAGTYNDKTSQTHCFYCGEHTNPQVYNSNIGATSVDDCQEVHRKSQSA
ncbi:hypothetical protein M407DRAFT_9185 [Tulasnella calospora MUT 4182]|uniref:Tyrosine-protein kinase ephrin type A/B receptor-like domain-containing protein n=1 Tax=Tulasnella calospora MUT 4182 TaxID=1051891 RepID=A0A0C3QDZ1_9AGAM|nr:hypothetical protein M407DRAFT_9185 [Tulasnella calospora MUT 4182]